MLKRIHKFLFIAISALAFACQKNPDTTPEPEGAGTCIPITHPSEFIILAWYEIIDINADSLLDEIQDPSTE